MRKLVWYLKQILPLRYETVYRDSKGIKRHTVYNMWFGRCYNIRDCSRVK